MNNDAHMQAMLSAIRSVLIAVGALMVQRGYTTDANVQEIVGALMVILPAVWGAWDKYRSEHATRAREAVAVNVGIAVADRTAGVTPPVPAEKAPAVIEAFKPVAPAPDAAAPNPTGLAISPTSPVLPTP